MRDSIADRRSHSPGRVAAPFAAVLAMACAVVAPNATAGTVQAYGRSGLYSSCDLESGATTGQASRDGAVIQTVDVSGDPSAASVPVEGGNAIAEVQLASEGVLAVRDAAGLPFSGSVSVRADRSLGLLSLRAATSYAAYEMRGYPCSAWVDSGGTGAEIVEHFDIRYPSDHVEPITVTLRLSLAGGFTENAGTNGWVNRLELHAMLGNTSQDGGLAPMSSPPVWSSEAGVRGEVVTVTGTLLDPTCAPGRDYCESFANLYVALALRSRALAGGGGAPGSSGAPSSADFTARLELEWSPGVTVVQRNERGDPEPANAWVSSPPTVPEDAGPSTPLAPEARASRVDRAESGRTARPSRRADRTRSRTRGELRPEIPR